MALKRIRESEGAESLATAQCLMLLSNSLDNYKPTTKQSMKSDVFECKTCNRKFPSFQALGGHRASHKRTKITGDKENDRDDTKLLSPAITKPKMHECSICGQEFSMGQALGGHMRRHKLAMTENTMADRVPVLPKLPVLRRSNSSKRVNVFGLDLNLTPLENDLEYLFGKVAPKLGHFI